MTPTPPKNQPPIILSINDLTQTRIHQTRTSMRWPVDEETTARLNRVIRLDPSCPVPWWKKLIRQLRGT